MLRFLTGGIFGFIVGAVMGIYKAVEVPDSKLMKTMSLLKGFMEVMSQ
jgi:hypothetical protein